MQSSVSLFDLRVIDLLIFPTKYNFLFHQEKGLTNSCPWAKCSPSPVFRNNILLEHSRGHVFTYWLLSHHNGSVEWLQLSLCALQSQQCSLSGHLLKKFLTSDPEHGRRSISCSHCTWLLICKRIWNCGHPCSGEHHIGAPLLGPQPSYLHRNFSIQS